MSGERLRGAEPGIGSKSTAKITRIFTGPEVAGCMMVLKGGEARRRAEAEVGDGAADGGVWRLQRSILVPPRAPNTMPR